MIKQKRGMGALAWILIILIVLAVGGIVSWLLLFGHGGSAIPQPPALPSG